MNWDVRNTSELNKIYTWLEPENQSQYLCINVFGKKIILIFFWRLFKKCSILCPVLLLHARLWKLQNDKIFVAVLNSVSGTYVYRVTLLVINIIRLFNKVCFYDLCVHVYDRFAINIKSKQVFQCIFFFNFLIFIWYV